MLLLEESSFSCKRVTTQMKALDEYIPIVLLILLLKRVHFLANETTEMKALDKCTF